MRKEDTGKTQSQSDKMFERFMCIFVGLCFFIILVFLATIPITQNNKNNTKPLKELHMVWFDERYGKVHLRSFDEGKIWYVFERVSGDSVKIKGVAEQVYPGILDSIQAKTKRELERAELKRKELAKKGQDDAEDAGTYIALKTFFFKF